MKKNKTLLPAVLACALLPLPAAAQGLQQGEWEITGTTTSPMLPQPQSNTVRRCVSKEDAADPARLATRDMQNCTVKQGPRDAGGYKWQFSCPSQGVAGDGSVRYTANTMNADIRMMASKDGQKAELSTKIAARYLGPCQAK